MFCCCGVAAALSGRHGAPDTGQWCSGHGGPAGECSVILYVIYVCIYMYFLLLFWSWQYNCIRSILLHLFFMTIVWKNLQICVYQGLIK